MARQRALTTAEAAKLLGITPEGVLQAINRGLLKAHRQAPSGLAAPAAAASSRAGWRITRWRIWLRDVQDYQLRRRGRGRPPTEAEAVKAARRLEASQQGGEEGFAARLRSGAPSRGDASQQGG